MILGNIITAIEQLGTISLPMQWLHAVTCLLYRQRLFDRPSYRFLDDNQEGFGEKALKEMGFLQNPNDGHVTFCL